MYIGSACIADVITTLVPIGVNYNQYVTTVSRYQTWRGSKKNLENDWKRRLPNSQYEKKDPKKVHCMCQCPASALKLEHSLLCGQHIKGMDLQPPWHWGKVPKRPPILLIYLTNYHETKGSYTVSAKSTCSRIYKPRIVSSTLARKASSKIPCSTQCLLIFLLNLHVFHHLHICKLKLQLRLTTTSSATSADSEISL